ncbi:hypothetical protein G7Y89_g7212 [Cudoniella acicularis]|uniref:NB-ARC domain-containing protein n=1 Tax=Cudoniella acicularis TaxID=354080 RepID=A0A8H4RMI0_9HELO|nr:hypothetical protein G7Y89_g7212 [Cudoniella acicularis]
MTSPYKKEHYEVGIICALAIEAAAMGAMLDETHPKLPIDKADTNDYTFGRIGDFNLIIACLPAGSMGNGPAAMVANNMRRSFSIKFGLMVGIGGGVWSKKADIRLGDVVVSQPTGTHGGVVQWDYGKMGKGGVFERTGSLNRPPPVLLHALQSLRTFSEGDYLEIPMALDLMAKNKPKMVKLYTHRGAENDQLFNASYDHIGDDSCEGCDKELLVRREPRADLQPEIHYGNIASGNEVMKHGFTRDQTAKKEDVICFEMEAAGLMNDFPCLVIRGVCDYADSHKNKMWQRYGAATAAAFARVFLGFVKKQDMIKISEIPKPQRLLPFGRNNHFVGRQSQLDNLIKIFVLEDKQDNCQRVALDGLGGVGKTHIALEFAFRLQEYSPQCSVFWVHANDATSFENSYREIGKMLHIQGIDHEQANVKELVQQWLSKESTGKWVLIIDNADDAQLFETTGDSSLSSYLPDSNLGGILFTTRNHEVATDHAEADVISIGMMDDSESRELLQTSLQKKNLLDDTRSTSKLLELLANLPLAIKQAGAFLNKKNTTISKYVNMLENSNDTQIKLLAKDFEDKWRYKGMFNPVATTWLISFKQVEQQNDLAARYMAFISFINEQNIPLSILPPASEFDQLEAIGTLTVFGFLTEQTSKGVYNMHRLVHIAMKNWLRIGNRLQDESTRAVEQVAAAFPWPEYDNRDTWTVYLPHTEHIIDAEEVSDVKESFRWDILDKLGRCFWLDKNHRKSIERYEGALKLKEKVLGKGYPSTLRTATNLGSSLADQGRYTEAETIIRETLALSEKVLGKKHPDTIISMGNLALLLNRQGRYTEAETIVREVLTLHEKVLGKEHPDTLTTVHWIAFLLKRRRQNNDAAILYQRPLSGFEKAIGKDHPNTLACLKGYKSLLEDMRLRGEGNEV